MISPLPRAGSPSCTPPSTREGTRVCSHAGTAGGGEGLRWSGNNAAEHMAAPSMGRMHCESVSREMLKCYQLCLDVTDHFCLVLTELVPDYMCSFLPREEPTRGCDQLGLPVSHLLPGRESKFSGAEMTSFSRASLLQAFIVKLISSPAVCGLTAVHSCLPSATHRAKMTLSCRRAVVLSSRACDSRLLAVLHKNASFCLRACWRMKDELFIAGRGGCCRPWRCCSHRKCI